MLSRLDFEIAGAPSRGATNRADVACFVGRVGRRPGAPLLSGERRSLQVAGWASRSGEGDAERRRLAGPWDVDAERVESLLHLPVVVESWDAFQRLFAWDARPLRAGGEGRCATWMGAAVRSFFAHGGRRAVVVRTGDPWPYLEGGGREARRDERLAELVPFRRVGGRPFDPTDPRSWRGVEHVYGLGEVSHLCLPDLADLCAMEPASPPVAVEPLAAPEVFVTCSTGERAGDEDRGVTALDAPRLEADGFRAWSSAVAEVRAFLARHRRDALLVASLPLPAAEARVEPEGAGTAVAARDEWLAFLQRVGVLEGAGSGPAEGGADPSDGTAASSFVHLVWPWLRTLRSEDLPGGVEPGEGLFAGLLAANALARGTFRSVAGTRLPGVVALEPETDMGLGPESPSALLAARVCLVGSEPDGPYLLSDVTSSPDPAWRPGGVSRLLATVVRAARRIGEVELFEPSGPETWRRIRRSMEGLLEGFFRAGALRGADPGAAFEVRCDRSTMTRNDLDNGRVRVEVTLRPAAPVERITVSLELSAGGVVAALPEVA